MSSETNVHPKATHTKLIIALTAIIASAVTFAITFSSMRYNDATQGTKKQISDRGAVFMSASQLKLQVKTTGEAFFWLGPLGDSTFTAVTTTDGVGTLIYWPANTNSANFNLPRRVVRYYPNLTTYAADHHPLNLPEDLRETRYTNGQMEYGIKNMDYQTFIYSDGSGIVEIHYAEAQTATVLEGNAELVSRVS